MSILDRYLWKSAILGILLAWFGLLLLDLFFAFINEMGDTHENYSAGKALIYLTYTIPERLYEYFPTAIIIGTMVGLGALAENAEFIAMRAAGISSNTVIQSTVKLGITLAVIIFVVGEWLIPAADTHARNFKLNLDNKNIQLASDSGLWIKSKEHIIHTRQVINPHTLSDITVITLKNDYSGVEKQITAESASLHGDSWQLHNVREIQYTQDQVKQQQTDSLNIGNIISTEMIALGSSTPDKLSSKALRQVIKAQQRDNLDTTHYELAFWKRFSTPLSAIVMLMMAVPFLFASQRAGGAGQRLFVGIIIGIVFFLISRTINELGLVYGLPAIISAFLPVILIFSLALFWIIRQKNI